MLKWVISAVLLCGIAGVIDGLAVMSVDLGTEFMKVAIVKPGVPMEIVLNKESRRKTPIIVSMRNGERLFSDPALNVAVRYPDKAYWYLMDLIGKDFDNPLVKLYQKRFPYYNLEADPDTNMVLFRHDEETTYTPEELLAMVLQHAKEIAEKFAEQTIHDAVLTVPAFFNQAERRAVARAANLAGLKLLQLMSDNSAVALNFGIFRRKEFTNITQHYMIFDMGAGSTTASVVGFQEVKQKNNLSGITEKFPQVQVKGVQFDRTLGGVEFQMRLRDHLAREFNAQKKTSTDVFTNKRSMAKLYKEAGRVKNVLSANNEHFAQVESLLDDQDFKVKVTRDQFEEMCADLFDRITKVVVDAIASSEITPSEFKEVLLMGAGTRVPKVQARLTEAVGREELGKSLNTDEAAAIGAVYHAAHLSKGFKVQKFGVKDATVFPIQVEFERVRINDAGEESTRTVKRTLFGRNNPYPQKKVMTFNKNIKDFSFVVNYGDLEQIMNEEQVAMFGKPRITDVALVGVGDAYDKYAAEEETEYKGVKAHFRVDESGILTLDHVESQFERAPSDEEPKEEEGILSKMGNTFSSFLGGGEKKEEDGSAEDAKEEPKQEEPPKEETKDEGKEEPKDEAKEEKKEESTDKESTDSKDKEKTNGNGKEKEKDKNGKKNGKKEEPKEKKPPKPSILKENVTSSVKVLDMTDPSKDSLSASREKLRNLKKKDEEKAKLEKAINELESYIVDMQDKLYQEAYEKCSTEENREEIRAKMSETSDWMYEVDETTPRKEYEDKLKEIKGMTKDLIERVKEAEERPKAFEALNSMMNYSEQFLKSMKNFTGDEIGEQPFTTVEYTSLEKLITETKAWNESVLTELALAIATEKPPVMLEDIALKISALDREVKYLVNKAKLFKPKPPKKEKEDNTTKADSNDTVIDKDSEGEGAAEEEEPKKEEEVPVADGASDGEEEGVQMDIPPMPGTEEEEKPRRKRKDKGEEDQDGEEPILELDGAAADGSEPIDTPPVEDSKDSSKDTTGHDPDDEL